MLSVCCNAQPVGWRDYDDMSGTCSKCGKPTAFYKEDDEVEELDKELEPLPPAYDSFIAMWDAFAEFVLSTDNKEE